MFRRQSLVDAKECMGVTVAAAISPQLRGVLAAPTDDTLKNGCIALRLQHEWISVVTDGVILAALISEDRRSMSERILS